MKFRKLFVFVLFCSTIAFSQNKKGDWNVSIAGSPYPTETNNEDDFGFLGLVGMEFFVSDKVSFSGSFFTSDNTLVTNNSDVEIHSYGFIPSLQYYFVNKQKWNIYGQAGYGFGLDDDTRFGQNGHALRIYSIGPGGHYVINKYLDFKLFFPYFNAKNKTLNVDAADGIAVFLGLDFKL